MSDQLLALETEALKLSLGDRARLAERLIASLDDGTTEADVEQLWIEEAERRLADLEAGRAVGIPIADALEQLRSALR
jgi:putative addiction module component (TIGR02574 family)